MDEVDIYMQGGNKIHRDYTLKKINPQMPINLNERWKITKPIDDNRKSRQLWFGNDFLQTTIKTKSMKEIIS